MDALGRSLLVLSVGIFGSVYADSWMFDKEIKKDTFTLGEIEVVRIIDTTENQIHPEYKLQVNRDGKQVALHKTLTFDAVTSFDKGNYLLGVSNSGLSTFAYFILDSSGKLVKTANHSDKLHYCKHSVTLVRKWVNDQSLNIEEKYKTLQNDSDPSNPSVTLESVTVDGCNGEKVEVWAQ